MKMVLKVYNTLTKKLEEFKPIEDKKVKMFVCGYTVYDHAHVGHAKSYIMFDVIVRYLKYKEYDVRYIQNVTDIDDKMIARANERKISVKELADGVLASFLEDMKTLNVTTVDKYLKATDYVPQIIEQIQGLLDKGYAYQSGGSVYYSIGKFKEYGKLSHRNMEEMVALSRIEKDPYKKEDADFVIWKGAKPGEPVWDSQFGKGRPGWHIEDTAISIDEYGPQYDIHGGGEDLIFPHHEAEIAIAEAFTGKVPFVKYWLHNAFITVNGKKMSKSLHNFVTIKDALKKHTPEAIRFYFTTTLYNKPIDYNDKNIENAAKELEKIQNLLDNLGFLLGSAVNELDAEEKKIKVDSYKKKFIESMDNNFNTASAAAVIFELVRGLNRLVTEDKLHNKKLIEESLALFKEWSTILGVEFIPKKKIEVPSEIMQLVEEREKARKAKDWKKADEFRKQIEKKGYSVDDTPEGPKIKKITS